MAYCFALKPGASASARTAAAAPAAIQATH
jgi:hypothetical protein